MKYSNFETTEFEGWPSGDSKPIFEFSLSPADIESRYHVSFSREKDDLDWYLGSHICDPVVGPVVMMRHENSISGGTIVYVDEHCNTSEAVERVKLILELEADEILWEAPCSK